MKKRAIPLYSVESYRPVHREITQDGKFGYAALAPAKYIPGFEIYSKNGIRPSFGPIKVNAYRLGFTTDGSVEVDLGLDTFTHRRGIITLTTPGSIFSYRNASADYAGYYCLFDEPFLWPLLQKSSLDYPFFNVLGISSFQLSDIELNKFVSLMWNIDAEVKAEHSDRILAVQHYLHLMLIEAKRCYEKQMPAPLTNGESHNLTATFNKLVSQHFLTKKNVADYANMMNVTANHLNKVVKTHTNQTASSKISYMLLLEAKARLNYTGQSVAELAYELGFSDPSAFNRFFKKHTRMTPLAYRTLA